MSRSPLPPPTPDERVRIRRASLRFALRLAAFLILGLWVASVVPLRPGPWALSEARDPFGLAWFRWHVPIALLTGAVGGFLFGRMIRFPSAAAVEPDRID